MYCELYSHNKQFIWFISASYSYPLQAFDHNKKPYAQTYIQLELLRSLL